MIFKERYKDITKTEKYFKRHYGSGYSIENNVIDVFDIIVTGHFGNVVSVRMHCKNICVLPLCNSTQNIGFIVRALVELFDKSSDNSVSITGLIGTPLRLVFDSKNSWGGKVIAIGNFMKDEFFLIEDLMKIEE